MMVDGMVALKEIQMVVLSCIRINHIVIESYYLVIHLSVLVLLIEKLVMV